MSTALFLRWWKPAAAVLLIGLAVYACHARDRALVEKGRAEAQLAELEARYRLDSATAHTRDTVVRADTIRLVQWTTRWDTAVKTVRLADTIRVREVLTVADSTIRACRTAVSSLTLSCQAKDSVIADLRAIVAVQPRVVARQGASLKERLAWGLGGLALGVVAGRVAP